MAFSSSSLGLPREQNSSQGDLGLVRAPKKSKVDTGDTKKPARCLNWKSLNAGLLGPGIAEGRFGWVIGSFWVDRSSGAPVSFWTMVRKVAGSAWTKVVLGEDGSDP
ncbi:hypothetical protein GH714_023678 [Hevea brasiliensis]|uniref:Uncharacterized protein n=1 Tax=Hevea brasiliensis TaxID=3981 RepID=A0A6A6LLJ2_HEVBR|nr:hypothetical protein GH714_023678 [Hevea brasiliensis]